MMEMKVYTKESLAKKLKSNIIILDYQHKQILDMFERVKNTKICKSNFYFMLIDIVNYLYSHTKTEEAFMRYIKYPKYLEHKERHEKNRRKLKNLLEHATVTYDFVKLGKELKLFVHDWSQNRYYLSIENDNNDVELIHYFNELKNRFN